MKAQAIDALEKEAFLMNSEKVRKFDVVIIGSGPGGEGAAMQAAKQGLKTVIIEKFHQVGGSCTHQGTIPSKALRQVAYRLTTLQSDSIFSNIIDSGNLSFSDLLKRAKTVIAKQVQMRTNHYHRNDIEIIHGNASLVDEHTVEVEVLDGKTVLISGAHIILATGSKPYQPNNIDFSHPRIFDSDSILTLDIKPRTVTVYGAGVIGCEYTSIFRALGKKVNLINTRSSLLSFLDDEISDALSYHLRDQGVLIRNNEELEHLEALDDGVIVHLKSGKRIRSDIILFATGRTGNSEQLGLEDLKIERNNRGHIKVNNHYQTNCPHIYAVGDLTGFPSLASSAYDQGRFASCHILNPNCDDALVKDIPVGIYTSPEISCIGKTEQELTKLKVPYEVGHSSFRHLARAQITGQTVGMLKILFHSETLQILGIHCFGQNAAEIVHIGQAIMCQDHESNSLKYFINTTFNYPTMAEAYRVAALNGINRLC